MLPPLNRVRYPHIMWHLSSLTTREKILEKLELSLDFYIFSYYDVFVRLLF